MMDEQNISAQWCEDDSTKNITNSDININELSSEEAFSKGSDFLSGQIDGYSLSESHHEFYRYIKKE